MNRTQKNKAFSLLELVVAMGIVGIMSVVALVSLRGGRTDEELETAALQVTAAIREAQNNALTGKNAGGGCNSYYFSCNTATRYTIGGSSGGCPETSYELSNGVEFNECPAFFYFSIPFGTLSPAAPQSIKLIKDSQCYQVDVTERGSVSTQKITCP